MSRGLRNSIAAAAALITLATAAPATAATFFVTKTDDTNDGVCDAADCSLREAVVEANTIAGADTIVLGSGTYLLSLGNAFENAAAGGDLDILSDVAVVGLGSGATRLNQGFPDRFFDVHPGASLALSDLELHGGRTVGGLNDNGPEGGAIKNLGALTIANAALRAGSTTARGGSIYNNGSLSLTDSEVTGSVAQWNWWYGYVLNNNGGAIYNDAGGHVTLTSTTLQSNYAGYGGGLYNAGTANVTNSTLANNGGNAVYNAGTLDLSFSTLAHNNGWHAWGDLVNVAGTATLSSSLIESPWADACNAPVPLVSGGHNVVDDASCGLGAGDLQNAVTDFRGVGVWPGSTRVSAKIGAGSAAKDFGDPAGAPATDQRGRPRSDGAPDAGSFERRPDDIQIIVYDASLLENGDDGDPGTVDEPILKFQVQLDDPATPANPVSFDYATSTEAWDDAIAGTDFVSTAGRFTLTSGTTGVIEVPIIDDTIVDGDRWESLTLNFSGVSGGGLSWPSTSGFIIDDEEPATVEVRTDNVREGDPGDPVPQTCSFRLTIDGTPLTSDGWIDWETTDQGATENVDFVDSSGHIDVLAGAVLPVTYTIPVTIIGDLQENEFTEWIGLALTASPNIDIAFPGEGGYNDFTCGIEDDDPLSVSVEGPASAVAEGDGGTTPATFTLRLSKPADGTTVTFQTQNGSADAGFDFEPVLGGTTYTFAGGEMSHDVVVNVLGDNQPEFDEDFKLVITDGGGAAIATPEAWAFIQEDMDGASGGGGSSSTGTSTTDPSGRFTITMPNGQRSNLDVSIELQCAPGEVLSNAQLLLRLPTGAVSAFPMTLGADGKYHAIIPASSLNSGRLDVSWDCNGTTRQQTIGRIQLFDPSGLITDAVTGDLVAGAAVTLYKAPGWEAKAGPDDDRPNTCESNASRGGADWSQPAPVALGELVQMGFDLDNPEVDPDVQPFVTGADGHYGWNVAAGCWFVKVEKDGYEPLVSPVVGVPTEVTDLNLELVPVGSDVDAPTVEATLSAQPNMGGWNKEDVTVTLAADDGAAGTGVAAIRYSVNGIAAAPVLGLDEVAFELTTEGIYVIAYSAEDVAGNLSEEQTLEVKLDKTAPAVITSVPAGNEHGWHNADMTATYEASDDLSGLAAGTETGEHTFVDEGADQSHAFLVTDLAGNERPALVEDVDIDKTAPSISTARAPEANGAGWTNSDVTASYSASDTLSGLAGPVTAEHVFGEGADQSHTFTISDLAGNTASADVSGVNVDKTKPEISATRAPDANGAGWNSTDVTASYSATDALSGLADPGTGEHVFGEGANQSHEFTVTDKAGNSASASIAGVNVDKTAPVIDASRAPGANGFGWNNGNVEATFAATDALSGLAGDAGKTVAFDAEGAGQSAGFSAVDLAGNEATASIENVNIDKTKPEISATRAPDANAAGWNNADVTASYSASDALSGLADPAGGEHVFGEGAGQSHTFTVTDRAGNSAAAGVSDVNVDKTAPTITATRAPDANPAGWNKTDVTASYSASDTLSGLADPATGAHVFGEGASQSHTFTVADLAGNTASAGVSDVNVDKTGPQITVVSPTARSYAVNAVVLADYACADALSGLVDCVGTVPDDSAVDTAKGSHTFAVSASDVAGNAAQVAVVYTAGSPLDEFLAEFKELVRQGKNEEALKLAQTFFREHPEAKCELLDRIEALIRADSRLTALQKLRALVVVQAVRRFIRC